MALLYQDDVGVQIIVETNNTAIPLTGTLSILLEKPGGDSSEISVDPTMVAYSTGIITYTTVAGDLDELGEYKVMIRFVDTGIDEVSDMGTFKVFEKIEV
jgi:hypothetical protein